MTAGPFCSIPGCVQAAVVVVLFAYGRPNRVNVCDDHFRPLRRVLLDVYRDGHVVAPAREIVDSPVIPI